MADQALTRIDGKQVLFRSSVTGEDVTLDDYLEACEYGDKTLAEILAGLVDTDSGDPIANGLYSYRGTWATATLYYAGDVVRAPTGEASIKWNVYAAVDQHTSSGTLADQVAGHWRIVIDVVDVTTQATAAAASASTASGHATTATTQATNAAASASTASTQASNASASAATATTQASTATAQAATATAQAAIATTKADDAETARAAAVTAKTAAETAETNAETAETNAETAETNAETAETNAETAETNAAASAATASTQASNAAASASTATTKADDAETARAAAVVAKDAAETAETNAELAETNAETAETNAAASAAAAAAVAAGIKWKASVRAATTANITLSGTQTIDGVSVLATEHVLVKDQTAPAENGPYVVAAGAWTRRTDGDSWTELVSSAYLVEEGTVNADRAYICTSNQGGTLGSTAVAFSGFGRGDLLAANNLSDVTASTARTNLAVYSTTEVDTAVGLRNLKSANLSDVANAPTARTNLGVGTGDSPQFAGLNIGDAADTTVTRTGAGDIGVEGNRIFRVGGVDVPIADGGTGASTAADAFTALKQASSTSATGVVETSDSSENLAGTATTTPTVAGVREIVSLMLQNSQSAAYTLVAADAGKHVLHPAADTNARTFTIPANSSVAYPVGTMITFVNETANVVTIAITTDTLTLAGSTTTGSRSLAQNGVATALKVTTTKWIISGTGLT